MEATLLSSISLLPLSKSVTSHRQNCLTTQVGRSVLKPTQLTQASSGPLTLVFAPVDPVRTRLRFSRSRVSSGDGGFGGSDGNSGSGGGGGGGGAARPSAVPAGAESASILDSDVIVLNVGGMTCGGCASSVKRILESQSQVSSATVDLEKETAVVWPKPEAKVAPNWQKELGEALAKQLTTCGFESSFRDEGANEGEIPL